MKTMTMTIATILTLQAGILFAGNENSTAPASTESASISLAPVAPVEATFEDVDLSDPDIAAFAPSTILEADFSDIAPTPAIDLKMLAPLTPAAADFE